MAGVAFSKISLADNVGYIIPWLIVEHFLKEYDHHQTFRGSCTSGFRFQDMENTHLRAYLKAHLSLHEEYPQRRGLFRFLRIALAVSFSKSIR